MMDFKRYIKDPKTDKKVEKMVKDFGIKRGYRDSEYKPSEWMIGDVEDLAKMIYKKGLVDGRTHTQGE